MLTTAQIEARKGRLTGSRVSCLMTADEAQILDLWRFLIGDPSYVEPDFSGVWPIQRGITTEPLNLRWFEKKRGPISRVGEVVYLPDCDWAAVTLDAWSDNDLCPVEAKDVGGWENLAIIIERYQPQFHWLMRMTGTTQCALSVIMGGAEPIVEFIPYDAEYADELWERAAAFMLCVRMKVPPVPLPAVKAPVIPDKVYQMDESNAWCMSAHLWRENREAAQVCKEAEQELKSLVPEDAKKCIGAGVQIVRDRSNRLSLKVQQ